MMGTTKNIVIIVRGSSAERKLTMNNKEYSGSLIFDAYEKDFIDNESIKFCNVYCKSRV